MKGASPSPARGETGDVELRTKGEEAELDFVTGFGAEPFEKVGPAPKPPQQSEQGAREAAELWRRKRNDLLGSDSLIAP